MILALLAHLGSKLFLFYFFLHEANLLCLLYKSCPGIKRISIKNLPLESMQIFKKSIPKKRFSDIAPMAESRFLRLFGTFWGPVDPRPWLNSPDPFSGLTCFLLHSVLSCPKKFINYVRCTSNSINQNAKLFQY